MINTARFNNNQERENSNTNEIEHFNLSQSDCVKIASTTFFSKKKQTMRDHRNRIKEMISFIEIKYPTYALQVVSIISDSDLENDRFHWYGAQKDFDFEKIHPDVIKAFMASNKIKKFKLPKHHLVQMRALQQNPEQ